MKQKVTRKRKIVLSFTIFRTLEMHYIIEEKTILQVFSAKLEFISLIVQIVYPNAGLWPVFMAAVRREHKNLALKLPF